MKLQHRVDEFGVLWFNNPVVTVRKRFVRGLGVFAAACWVLVFGLFAASPGLPILGNGPFEFILAAAIICTAWYGYRRGHPMYVAGAPRSIGFSPIELHVPRPDGTVLRIPWREIRSVEIARGPEFTSEVVVDRGSSQERIVSLNLDVAIKIRWARRLAARAVLSTDALLEPFRPSFPLHALPPGGIPLDSSPTLALYPDRVVLWKKDRGEEFPRADVDFVVFPLLKEDRFIVTIRGHQAAFVLHEAEARRLLDWFEWDRLTSPA